MAADDEVGYCKPPKKHRFKKGQSGNPKGRPKGSPNLVTAVRRALADKVTVTEGGQKRVISKLDAAATQMVNRAAGGDARAFQQLADLNDLLDGPTNKPAVMSLEDERVVEDIVRRMRASTPKDGP